MDLSKLNPLLKLMYRPLFILFATLLAIIVFLGCEISYITENPAKGGQRSAALLQCRCVTPHMGTK